jgi:hypothetical protein
MYTASITLALYVSAAFIIFMVVAGLFLCALAHDTHGKYAKRKAWQDVRTYAVGCACAAPLVTGLIVIVACMGQMMAGGAA